LPARCSQAAPAPAENLIHAGWSRCTGETMVYTAAADGRSCDGEGCGRVMDRAAATGLPRCDERVRAAAAAAGEQPGAQGVPRTPGSERRRIARPKHRRSTLGPWT